MKGEEGGVPAANRNKAEQGVYSFHIRMLAAYIALSCLYVHIAHTDMYVQYTIVQVIKNRQM
jgi:hypothetical protein